MTLYILDSDHLSLYQRNYESIGTYLLRIQPEDIAITIVSIEELIRGRFAQIRKANTPQKQVYAYHWLSITFKFLCDYTILKYDAQAEARFQTFRAQKIRVGTQDLRIAAIALSHNATIVTRNKRDFARIPALRIEDWSVPK